MRSYFIIFLFLSCFLSAQTAFVGLSGSGITNTAYSGEGYIGKKWDVSVNGGYFLFKDFAAVGGVQYSGKWNYSVGAKWFLGGRMPLELAYNNLAGRGYTSVALGVLFLDSSQRVGFEPNFKYYVPIKGSGDILTYGINVSYFLKK